VVSATADQRAEGAPRRSLGEVAARVRESVVLAVFLGLVSGLAFAAEKLVRTLLLHRIISPTRDVAWMAPVASVFVFVALALPLGLAGGVLPRRMGQVVVLIVLGTLAGISLTFLFPYASHLALGVLSLGLAVALTRVVVARPEQWWRRMRRANVGLGATVVGAFGLTQHLLRPPAASSASGRDGMGMPPNVMIIVLDAVSANALSLYGNPRLTTPYLDAFAREGTVFDSAYAVAPWTLPSHLSMLTGDYQLPDPARSKFLYRPPTDQPRLPDIFRELGYATVGVVANLWRTQWDTGLNHGFDLYRDHQRTLAQLFHSSLLGQTRLGRDLIASRTLASAWAAITSNDFTVPPEHANPDKDARAITDEYLAWHRARPPRPFFALLNYADPHLPYTPPAHFATRFSRDPDDRARYDAELAYADSEVGRLLDSLRVGGTLDNTVTIITSDHGELFGQHGFYEHSSNLYHDLLHVPLIVRFPRGVPVSRRITRAVSLRDLAATIMDLSGAHVPAGVPGTSLATLWRDSTRATSPILASVDRAVRRDSTLPFAKGAMVSLMIPPWRYIRNDGTGHEELYNLAEDPGELSNRVGTAAAESVLKRLRDSTNALVRQFGPAGQRILEPAAAGR
jgi:arylsulfatase A-like enzyme